MRETRLAKDPQEDIAALAQKAVDHEKATGKLKKSPLDPKFIVSDGSPVDLAKLREKVMWLVGKDGRLASETDGDNRADQVQKLLQAK